jgi:hypothetical protein
LGVRHSFVAIWVVAQKASFELVHPGVYEHKCGVGCPLPSKNFMKDIRISAEVLGVDGMVGKVEKYCLNSDERIFRIAELHFSELNHFIQPQPTFAI